MSDPMQPFTDMMKKLGAQFDIPSFDMSKAMDHHRRNLEALQRSWMALAGGATAVANRQRELFEAALQDALAMAKDYKPAGSPQEIFAKQTEFAGKAMEAVANNTRDIAELVQKSTTEALKIVHDRMHESYSEIRSALDKR